MILYNLVHMTDRSAGWKGIFEAYVASDGVELVKMKEIST